MQAAPELTFTRLRWSLVVPLMLPIPLVLGVLFALAWGSVWPGLVFIVVLMALTTRRRGLRGLAWTDHGLVVQRDAYRLVAAWDDVVEVSTRWHHGLRSEDLVLSRSEVQPVDSRGRASHIPEAVQRVGADRRIQVSFYDKNWRRGRIGDELRRRGVID